MILGPTKAASVRRMATALASAVIAGAFLHAAHPGTPVRTASAGTRVAAAAQQGTQNSADDAGSDVLAGGDPFEILGHIGGFSFDVEVSGRYAYYGAGLRLMVVDVHDPSRPAIVGTSEFVDQPITSEAQNALPLSNARTCFDLYAFDISVPAAPSLLPGSLDLSASDQCDIHSDGTRILALADESLEVYEYSDAAHPEHMAAVGLLYDARTMHVGTDRAYVVEGEASALHILDTSDPENIIEIGYLELIEAEGAPAIDLDGNRCYVCAGSRLTIVDTSEPGRPTEIGASTTHSCDGLVVVGGLLYLTSGAGGDFHTDAAINVVDASDPLNVTSVGNLVLQGDNGVADIEVIDGIALVVTSSRLRVVSVADPASPEALQLLPIVQRPDFIAAVGRFLYLVGSTGDVWVFDVAEPAEPRLRGHTDATAGFVEDMVVDGEYAYLGCVNEDVLVILSLADPRSPEVVVRMDEAPVWRLAKEGRLLYALSAVGGRLQVYDVENPSAPQLLGEAENVIEGVAANDIVVSNGRAFIADRGTESLVVVDVSDPESMHRMASVPWEREIFLLEKHASLLLALESSGGLQIYDVDDPFSPEKQGYWFLGIGTGLVAHEDVAYVARGVWQGRHYPGHRQVVRMDLRDPLHPVPAGAIDVSGAHMLALSEGTDRLYAAGIFTGAFILRRDDRLVGPGRPFWSFLPAALAAPSDFGKP